MGKRNNTTHSKILVINVVLVCSLVVFVIAFVSRTGMIKNLNEEADAQVESVQSQAVKKLMVEGIFLDRDGAAITVAGEPGAAAGLVDPPVYSILVGYNAPYSYGTSGLRKKFENYLFSTDKEKNYTGDNIQLTTDNELSRFCYELLGEEIGSIVVLDNKTGDVLAAVSRGHEEIDYDANQISSCYEQYAAIPSFFLHRAFLASDPPGSTGKIYTACALSESGNLNFVHEDNGKYFGIDNAGGYHYGPVGITKAFTKSINTYFASSADMVGIECMENIYKAFGLGEDIALEFTTLSSVYELETDTDLRYAGFGQGKTLISPLHLTMSLSDLINDGVMYEPHIMLSRYDGITGALLYTREVTVLKENVVSEKTANKLKDMLSKAAASYGLAGKGTVYAKTGTAEVSPREEDPGAYHIYILVGTEEYSCIISIDRTDKGSGSLKPLAQQLLDYLESEQWKGGN